MRSLLPAVAFLAATAYSLVLPPSYASRNDGAFPLPTVDSTSVLFSVPYSSLWNTQRELYMRLTIESPSSPCEPSTILLNGDRLSSNPSPMTFQANSSEGGSARSVDATWRIFCLNSHETILSVDIEKITGQFLAGKHPGFSISFVQGSFPQILRLEHASITAEHENVDALQQWTKAQVNPEFVVLGPSKTVGQQLPSELQEQFRRLHEIKARIARLHHEYMRQEHRVLEMIKQDFSACQGPACIFQTAMNKAPDFFELVKAHFRHRPDWAKLRGPPHESVMSGTSQHEYTMHLKGPDGFPPVPGSLAPGHTPFPIPFDAPHRDDSYRHHAPSFLAPPFDFDDDFPPLPPWDHRGPPPPPFEHGNHPPPPPPWHASEHDGIINTLGAHPPWAGHHPPNHHSPRFFHRHGPHRHPLIYSVSSIFFFVVIASLLFNYVRSKTSNCNNSQFRRDCAARREECRSRAAYRRAAMRHRWRNWWSQFRQPASTADYEEKRARILGQEDTLEDVMQSEIQQLRRAHEMVGDMVRAEETRQRMYHEANFGSAGPSSSSSQASPQLPGTQHHNFEGDQPTIADPVLPLYQPPPPSYEQELEGDMMVVDGFSYTASATDSTPDSSVVDCSPRMSFETSTTVTKT